MVNQNILFSSFLSKVSVLKCLFFILVITGNGADPIGHNVCVSAVVPFRSRVLFHETKTLNEDNTLN